jgi:hypothetical protein
MACREAECRRRRRRVEWYKEKGGKKGKQEEFYLGWGMYSLRHLPRQRRITGIYIFGPEGSYDKKA